ncbi:restriction endonuclease [Streptomyces sp. QHH-9511]|uniref:restriction endonuclease n=2 Tax=Streptomyces TaxID=1883 RepID=UPI0019ABB89A|nr:restriction endonuclease [Streptomyces sp. QHH-9511]GGT78543.1 restriction endonuclease [Streptomyces lateritius]
MRQLVLALGLAAIVLCAVGLTLKLIVRTATERPGAALAGLVLLGCLIALMRKRRRRRAAVRVASSLDGLAHRIATAPGPPVEPSSSPVAVEGDAPDASDAFRAEDLAAMDPDSFEQAVAALCERDGCRDVHVVGGAGDLGADIIATTPDGQRIVIQCKRYGPLNKVGSQDVQRFGGTCFSVHEAQVAAVVTTGEFTQPAAEYAQQCGIRCVDHRELVAWTEGTGPTPWD